MKKFLSIDWDYFINATALDRAMMFPDGGNENISKDLQKFVWDSHYDHCPGIREVGLLNKDYMTLRSILWSFSSDIYSDMVKNNIPFDDLVTSYPKMLVTISHKWLYDFIIEHTSADEEIEIYNIDFHHDMYIYRTPDERVNCGNWVNCIKEDRPSTQYFWVKREDSENKLITGEEPDCTIKSLEDISNIHFDYVFMCRSDCWSPPHLDSYFYYLWKDLSNCIPVKVEDDVLTERERSYPDLDEEQRRDRLFMALKS